MPLLTGCLSLVLLLPACEPRDSQGTEGAVVTAVDTIGGVIRVRNSGDAPEWTSSLVLRLGSVGSLGEPAPDEFGIVSSAILGPEDRLYVADQMNHEIRVFELSGELVTRFGREGQGPGEFLAIYGIGWLGDTLMVLDYRNGRIGMTDPDGRWLGQRNLVGNLSGSPANMRFYPVGTGETYIVTLIAVEGGIALVYIRHTMEGGTDTIPLLNQDDYPNHNIICDPPSGLLSVFDIPFFPAPLQHPARGGRLATAWSAEYRVAIVDAAGDTVRVIEREAEPVPVTEADWEAGLSEYREYVDEHTARGCEPRSPNRPDFKPPMVQIFFDHLGRMWIEAERPEGRIWEIFDPDGRLIGRMPVIPDIERAAPFFGEDLLAVVSQDSLEIPTVEVYRFGRTFH
jgi:hypothetical protein